MLFLNVLLSIILGAYVGKLMAFTVHFLPPILLEEGEEEKEPRDIIKWIFQKPFCWKCRSPYAFVDSLPVVGYFMLKGRCPFCGDSLEKKVIILEMGVAALFGISTLLYPVDLWLLFVLGISCLLICCFITDFEYGILPDQLTLAIVWVGLAASLHPIVISPQEAILGAIAGYGIPWGFNELYRCMRKIDGMYPGDFKLNAGIGACLGLNLLIPILVIAMVMLVVCTLIKEMAAAKSTTTGHMTTEVLYKEVPYACYVSGVTIMAMYTQLN